MKIRSPTQGVSGAGFPHRDNAFGSFICRLGFLKELEGEGVSTDFQLFSQLVTYCS